MPSVPRRPAPGRGSSRAAPSRRRPGSARSSAPRPPAACCSSRPRRSRWSGRTARGPTSYDDLRDLVVGPEALHLDLTLGTWAADGLLAIFFFVAGPGAQARVRRRRPARPAPGRAAGRRRGRRHGRARRSSTCCRLAAGGGDLRGWAIPTATDIAFALAILAVISTHLPVALRTFLLTLAVVDDLLAITIIAVFYTERPRPRPTSRLALLPIARLRGPASSAGSQRGVRPPARSPLVAWALVHASGVHATVAGVLLAFTVPVRRRDGGTDAHGLAEHLEHLVRPVSAGVRRAGLRVLRRRRDGRRHRRPASGP